MNHVVDLTEGDMANSARWNELLTQLGIPAADWALVKTVELSIHTILIRPS